MSEKPEDKTASKKKMTARRQAILAGAFAQLRKSRKSIEPGILQKIREFVSGSPEIMQTLGVNDVPDKKADESMPLSSKSAAKPIEKTPVKQERPISQPQNSKAGYETIDQEKNMDIVAKLMELSPDNRENIKSVLKKNQK